MHAPDASGPQERKAFSELYPRRPDSDVERLGFAEDMRHLFYSHVLREASRAGLEAALTVAKETLSPDEIRKEVDCVLGDDEAMR